MSVESHSGTSDLAAAVHPKRWLAPGTAIALGVSTLFVLLTARHGGFQNWDALSFVAENDHVNGGIS